MLGPVGQAPLATAYDDALRPFAAAFETGPPLLGAPWLDVVMDMPDLAFRKPAGRGVAIVGTSNARKKSWVPRLPQLQGDKDFERLRHITEMLSIIMNSLMNKGQLKLFGVADYTLDVTEASEDLGGVTGTFP